MRKLSMGSCASWSIVGERMPTESTTRYDEADALPEDSVEGFASLGDASLLRVLSRFIAEASHPPSDSDQTTLFAG